MKEQINVQKGPWKVRIIKKVNGTRYSVNDVLTVSKGYALKLVKSGYAILVSAPEDYDRVPLNRATNAPAKRKKQTSKTVDPKTTESKPSDGDESNESVTG